MKLKPYAPILALLLFYGPCNGGDAVLTSLRIALASAPPLVNSLIASGAIPETQAGPILTDFNDAVVIATALRTEIQAAGEDRAGRLAAAQEAEAGWKAIYKRGHFGLNPRISQAADIADGIFQSVVLFYGGTPVGPVARDAPKTQKELGQHIKAEVERMKDAMKP